MITLKNHKIKKCRLIIHKKPTLIISLVILFIIGLVVSGLFFSQKAWKDYDIESNQHFASAKTDIDNVITQTSDTNVSPADRLNNIIEVQVRLAEESKNYCEINPFISWQSFIKQSSDKISSCNQQKDKLNQLLSKINDLTNYLKAEQELSAIIKTANDSTSQNNQSDKWINVEAFWRQAVTSTSSLSDIDQFKDIKALAITNLTKIADVWQQLSSANASQNRSQFETACANLSIAYASLSEISAADTAQINILTTNLSESYEDIY